MSILKHSLLILILMTAVEGFSQWIPTAPPVETEKVYSITKKGNYWFAGTLQTGVYRKGINDSDWVPKNRNLNDVGIEFMGANDNYVFAVSNQYRIYRSSNDGDDWEQLNHYSPVTSFICYNDTVLVSASNGLRISYNNGETWSLLTPSFGHCYNITRINGKIYIPKDKDIYLSTNNGANWNIISGGIPSQAFAQKFGAGPDAVFTVRETPGSQGYTRIYRTTNDGITWEYYNASSHPNLSGFFYSNGYYYFTATNEGIYRSSNAGATWSKITNGLPQYHNMNSIFADGNEVLTGGWLDGMYRSSNFGSSWSEYTEGFSDITIDDMYYIPNGMITRVQGIGLYKAITVFSGKRWINQCPTAVK